MKGSFKLLDVQVMPWRMTVAKHEVARHVEHSTFGEHVALVLVRSGHM